MKFTTSSWANNGGDRPEAGTAFTSGEHAKGLAITEHYFLKTRI